MKPNILGLDISKTRTGVCFGRIGDKPKFASVVGTGLQDRKAAVKLGRWLIDLTKVEEFDSVWIEAQINFAAFIGRWNEERRKVEATSNPETTMTLAKMIGVAEFVCEMRSIPVEIVPVSTVRVGFIGKGNMKSEPAKAASRMMCAELGWDPENFDESDAGAVWFYGGLKTEPHACQIITPMMQRRVVTHALGKELPGGLYADS